MIGVLTSNFVLYHDIVNALQRREIPFVSLTFNSPVPFNIDVIITSEEEKAVWISRELSFPSRERAWTNS